MKCGSLFSGAGLLDIGMAMAGVEHGWFVESDSQRREHLAKRWPDRPVHDDVRTVGVANLERVDCIAGGFPCKGASTAGKRTGLAHPETALWAEFYRIVGELRPRYVVIENVANLLAIHDGAVWGTVLGDLAALGYDVAWDCVPAAAFGAPHGRDRVVAIAADAQCVGLRAGWGDTGQSEVPEPVDFHRVAGRGDAPDAALLGHERGGRARAGRHGLADGGQAAADPGSERRNGRPRQQDEGRAAAIGGQEGDHAGHGRTSPAGGVAVEWGQYEPAIRRWEAVHGPAPEPLVRRVDDGLPNVRRMRSRVDRSRLSALGDGVHVYLGRLIGDALLELERGGREVASDA